VSALLPSAIYPLRLLLVCTSGLEAVRGNGKIGKINREAVSGADRCFCPDVGGVHGNTWPEVTAETQPHSADRQERDANHVRNVTPSTDMN